MKTVRQLLESKGNKILSIDPAASVHDALMMMAENQVGALLVMERDKLAGIFSERDYARNITHTSKSARETQVSELMTPQAQLITIAPDNTVENCMQLVTEKRIRHLPVIEAGKVIGVLSIGDLVKETIEHQRFLITQLENYIKS